MPRNHSVYRALQRSNVELAMQAHHLREVVNRVPRIELVEEPPSLLREAQRKVGAVNGFRNGSRANCARGIPDGFYSLREFRNRGRFEHCPQGDLEAEDLPHTRNDLSREQRMASQGKKVIVDADTVKFQNLRPRARDHLLDRSSRCNKLDSLLARGKLSRIDRAANAGNIAPVRGNTR